jgi:hypothetical protein
MTTLQFYRWWQRFAASRTLFTMTNNLAELQVIYVFDLCEKVMTVLIDVGRGGKTYPYILFDPD